MLPRTQLEIVVRNMDTGFVQEISLSAFLHIEEGAAAARDGSPASANPYGSETLAGGQWLVGWVEALDAVHGVAGDLAGFERCFP